MSRAPQTPRQAMDLALRNAVRQTLRPLGFQGSLPHLRHLSTHQVRLITIGFFSWGGEFYVEVADCDPTGLVTPQRTIPASKMTVWDAWPDRPRLHRKNGDGGFTFGPRMYEPDTAVMHPDSHYEALAQEAMEAILTRAVPFWESRLMHIPAGPDGGSNSWLASR